MVGIRDQVQGIRQSGIGRLSSRGATEGGDVATQKDESCFVGLATYPTTAASGNEEPAN